MNRTKNTTKKLNRDMFIFPCGFIKTFPNNNKKEKRRVDKFAKKFYNFNTWFDKNIIESERLKNERN